MMFNVPNKKLAALAISATLVSACGNSHNDSFETVRTENGEIIREERKVSDPAFAMLIMIGLGVYALGATALAGNAK